MKRHYVTHLSLNDLEALFFRIAEYMGENQESMGIEYLGPSDGEDGEFYYFSIVKDDVYKMGIAFCTDSGGKEKFYIVLYSLKNQTVQKELLEIPLARNVVIGDHIEFYVCPAPRNKEIFKRFEKAGIKTVKIDGERTDALRNAYDVIGGKNGGLTEAYLLLSTTKENCPKDMSELLKMLALLTEEESE